MSPVVTTTSAGTAPRNGLLRRERPSRGRTPLGILAAAEPGVDIVERPREFVEPIAAAHLGVPLPADPPSHTRFPSGSRGIGPSLAAMSLHEYPVLVDGLRVVAAPRGGRAGTPTPNDPDPGARTRWRRLPVEAVIDAEAEHQPDAQRLEGDLLPRHRVRIPFGGKLGHQPLRHQRQPLAW